MRKPMQNKIEEMVEEKIGKRKKNFGTFFICLFLSMTVVYLTIFPALTMTEKDGIYPTEDYEITVEPELGNNGEAENVPIASNTEEARAEIPVEEVPAEIPIEEVPAEIPIEEIPTEETPTEEIPTEETPIEEEPIEEAPVEEIPSVEIPVEESLEGIVPELPEEWQTEEVQYEFTEELVNENEYGILPSTDVEDQSVELLAMKTVYERVNISSINDLTDGTYIFVLEQRDGTALKAPTQNGEVLTKTVLGSNLGNTLDGDYGDLEWTVSKKNNSNYYNVSANGLYFTVAEGAQKAVATTSSTNTRIQVQGGGVVFSTGTTAQYLNLHGGTSSNYFGGYSVANDAGAIFTPFRKVAAEVSDAITYKLNLPQTAYGNGTQSASVLWETGNKPSLSESEEVESMVVAINSGDTVITPRPYNYFSEAGVSGIENLYRGTFRDGQGLHDSTNDKNYLGDYPWYSEYRFDGWKTVDTDGNEFIIPPDAEIDTSNAEYLSATGTDGQLHNFDKAVTLEGVWKEVSSIVVFFVNYTGTILDKEGDVSGRPQSDYTGVAAVGRYYYGENIVSQQSDTFATAVNNRIVETLTDEFAPNREEPQLVIDYLTAYKDGSAYANIPVSGAVNQSILEESVFEWIRNDSSIQISINTSSGTGTVIPNENVNSDNYGIRWYICKEQNDQWHIDGVVVVKTAEINVSKEFYGLSDSEIAALLDSMTVQMDMYQGSASSVGTYLTLSNSSVDGQYEYYYDSASKTAHWAVRVPNGEYFKFTEKNYKYTNRNVYSTAVVDDSYDGALNFEDTTDNGEFSIGDYMSVEGGKKIQSGYANLVEFENVYTQENAGYFAIYKTDSAGDPLGGAEFTLTDENGNKKTVVTNASGIGAFTDITLPQTYTDGQTLSSFPSGSTGSGNIRTLTKEESATYTLTETAAPEGYMPDETVHNVNVSGDITYTITRARSGWSYTYTVTGVSVSNMEIRVDGIECFSTADGAFSALPVQNTPYNNSINIYKMFTGDISATEIASLTDFKITVISADKTQIWEKRLSEAQRSGDGKTYMWTISGLNNNAEYTVSESGYLHNRYNQNNASATYNSLTIPVSMTDGLPTVSIVKTENTDNIILTNTYSNRYSLAANKVDEGANPLAGAQFVLYTSDYDESSNPSENITVDNTRYYFFAQSAATEASGRSTISNLDPKNTYYLKETTAPEGYDILSEPILIQPAESDIVNGVYETTVVNKRKNGSITVKKEWVLNGETAPESVQMWLVRKAEGGDYEMLMPFYVTAANGWTHVLEDIELSDENKNPYTFYIYEVPTSSFAVNFSSDETVVSFRHNGRLCYAVQADAANNAMVTVYNVHIEVPSSGGIGTKLFIIAGLLLICIALLLYIKINFCGKGDKN